jgi:hypothetical protein
MGVAKQKNDPVDRVILPGSGAAQYLSGPNLAFGIKL